MKRFLSLCACVAVAFCSAVPLAHGHSACPDVDDNGYPHASDAQKLEGKLVFHNGLRAWYELRLDKPKCGISSLQLVQHPSDDQNIEKKIKKYEGCRVFSKGVIDFSPTGYYALEVFQSVTAIEPVGACAQKPLPPDFSQAKPYNSITSYRVMMHVDYVTGDHPILFRVSSGGRELHPWQAYASYLLTGSNILYGYCAEGFAVGEVFGTPQAQPSHFAAPGEFDDAAAYSPETAAESGHPHMDLGYTCSRVP